MFPTESAFSRYLFLCFQIFLLFSGTTKFQQVILKFQESLLKNPFVQYASTAFQQTPTVNTVDTFLKQLINNTEKLNVLYIFH
jgi:hypothetical protein